MAIQFCLRAQYSAESLQALIQNPTDRTQAIRSAVEAAGGKLANFYGTGGGDDNGVMIIYEVQDGTSASALTSALIASNALRNISVQRLYTATETVEALKKAQTINKAYEAPSVRRS